MGSKVRLRRGQYTEAELVQAVSRVADDKERGINVSQTSGIPYRTLMQRVRERKRGILPEKKRRGSKPSLTLKYEHDLLAWMLGMQTAGNPVGRKEIIERANDLIKQLKPDATLGEGWYRRFINRHPSLEVQPPPVAEQPTQPNLKTGLGEVPSSSAPSMPIVIRGYKKRTSKATVVADESSSMQLLPFDHTSVRFPPPPVDIPDAFRRQDLQHRWDMERERLLIDKQTHERAQREALLNERILLAKATEAELQLKVAKAKAKHELEQAGLSPAEIDEMLQ
ncbi:hypothetical protein DYB37_002835 [Aphanomyces astaci]|uniref:HTH CENPB-type domain-containing protein n=2 Tax=Aphanomyces astaci TaxID=112090 RepID=A0A397B3A8_APHAT|nr:hypothetical protein DYB25_004667 [Aphanomyces astaci]RHY14670.1 hypothetical protein DYB36_011080 [Aphanomyces astaci]RHY42446.1 hypothetical protein DYB34_014138 [Aphanomyces astaci]RHY49382.1 hypothetical protein DYB30_011127 [Aphanomyces astaci]RHY61890.1 hypothetical protein DYB38_012003 [Aphanomyces astaci]